MTTRALLLCLALGTTSFAATQLDIAGPAGSGAFGTTVTVLPNGNFVVTDPFFSQISPAISNIGAVHLYNSDGLLRAGTANDLVGLGAVDVNPVTGRYTAIGTLSGGLASENQALWTGNPTLGNDTTLRVLRQPILRLRKGQIYRTENTPQSLVRSLTLKPATDTTGAGGRGLAQCIGANGDVAVYILGDRSLTEPVMLPP